MVGMGLAVLTTLFYRPPADLFAWFLVVAGIAIGALAVPSDPALQLATAFVAVWAYH